MRDVLTSEARATRVRRLATPSWLSTRTKPVVEPRAGPVSAATAAVVRTASPTWSPLPRPDVFGFSRLRSGLVASKQDDFVVSAVSLGRRAGGPRTNRLDCAGERDESDRPKQIRLS